MAKRPPKPAGQAPSPRHGSQKKSGTKDRGLNDLRKPPTGDEFRNAWEEVENGTARSAALISASYVETVLEFTIFSRLIPLDKKQRDTLVARDGPLNSFYAKIELGHALGLYGAVCHRDLTIIRHVRNTFAHTMRSLSFDTPEIAKEVSKLEYLTTIKYMKTDDGLTLGDFVKKGFAFKDNRTRYVETCKFFVQELSTTIDLTSVRSRRPCRSSQRRIAR